MKVDQKDLIRVNNFIKILNDSEKMQFTFKGAPDVVTAYDCLLWLQSVKDRIEQELKPSVAVKDVPQESDPKLQEPEVKPKKSNRRKKPEQFGDA